MTAPAEYTPCGQCSVCCGCWHEGAVWEVGNSGPGWLPPLPEDSCRARWARERAGDILEAAGFRRPT